MAKFYQRYLPPTADNVVQYGYRGTNYTVNGQFYFTTNNVEQVGTYQYTCAPSRCGSAIAPIVAPSMFEPSLGLTPFDASGSRFSGEYNAARFNSFGSYKDSANFWSFKNQTCIGPLTFNVQDNTGIACLCGCVCAFGDQTGDYATGAVPGSLTNLLCCYLCNNYLVVEHPVGCFNCFVPNTFFKQYWCADTCCNTVCIHNFTAMLEATNGTTCANISFPNCISYGNGGGVTMEANVSGGYCEPFGIWNAKADAGDQFYFGTTCNNNLQASGTACGFQCTKSNHTWGVSFQHGCAFNAPEYGSRIFLANLPPYSYYMHFNSLNGGIQGSDTVASGGVGTRLKLKMYSSSNTATTTIYNIPKGLGGYITPSNPDFDTGSGYRFYLLQFTGNDMPVLLPSSTGSIALSRITLTPGGTVTSSTYTLRNADNSGPMVASDMAQIYTNAGNNNTAAGQLDHMSVRRQTVNRVWISFDANSVKRLHMGVYNTNGTQLISSANGFNSTGNRGDMFYIYSWELSDAGLFAEYVGRVSTAQWAPRYFCPLDPGNVTLGGPSIPTMWNALYVGCTFSNDIIMTLNASTGLYQYQNTMPYVAARLFKDKDSRWCAQVYDGNAITNNGYNSNYIDVITSDVGQTISLTTTATSFVYTGTTVASSINVSVYNYLGARVVKTVSLSVVGQTANPGITFGDGTYFTSVATSASTETNVVINLISAAYAKIVGTVAEI